MDFHNHSEVLEHIGSKRTDLKNAAKELKKHFVGLDDIIDKIIKNIEIWYIMPELLTRPIIINLWGMTGVGKTDLVRRLVSCLNFNDRYAEMQMTNKGTSQDYGCGIKTLSGFLNSSNLTEGKEGILLLDEIQRFRTVDQDDREIHDYQFQDIWMLLSDGKLTGATSREDIYSEICMSAYQEENEEEEEDAPVTEEKTNKKETSGPPTKKKKNKPKKFSMWYYEAARLKRLLRLTEPTEEIMTWSREKKKEILLRRINDPKLYQPRDFTKLLIFISGNIDEAYKMSHLTENANVDADLFHKETLKINFLTIKKRLTKRFKPEQIARLGNTHVIYPSLSKKSYEEIINRKITQISTSIEKKTGIQVVFCKSVNDAIYKNGVFPAQGTRPVFSTITSFLEANTPFFLFKTILNHATRLEMYYREKYLYGKVNNETYRVSNEGEIEKIEREDFNKDRITCVSVHEAGHAVSYAILFGYAPTQIKINLATVNDLGFVNMHSFKDTEKVIKNRISCLLAGKTAEQIMFGLENVSSGCSKDLSSATGYATSFIRNYGMGKKVSVVAPKGVNHADAAFLNNDSDAGDVEIEELMSSQGQIAFRLLSLNKKLMLEVAQKLIKEYSISPDDFQKICEKHGVGIVVEANDKEAIWPRYSPLG